MASAEAAKSLWDFDFFAPRPVSNLYGTLIHIRRSDVSSRRHDAVNGLGQFFPNNKHNIGKFHDGHSCCRDWNRVLCSMLRLHQSLRQAVSLGDRNMLFDYILGGAVTLFLLAYLTYALFRPERF
ncbi:K(+)-transporting ATPase subunit F [Mesorhizobium sp. M0768]|uniref:K(+)-transporting ATPase subunit F n=1 Tax=unclassified Mesorhizobium TaxID=325217 RepID=UPI0033374277